MSNANDTSRRDFLKTSALAAASSLALAGGVYAEGRDPIKVGLIGCGGRGRGAAHNVLVSAPNVVIHALADAFPDRIADARQTLDNVVKDDPKIGQLGNKVDVGDRAFVGLDAYKKLLASDVNYVILATPPGFRPIHLEAAVAAGKNIFTEKPVAVDGTGIRKVLAAYQEALKKNLAIAAGTQRRHQLGYQETMKRIHDGAIGELVGGRCYWNQGILWANRRQPGMTDLQWQMRNWYNFTWLCGDHIVEQHVHNLDVLNWAMKTHPIKAVGMGGCSRKPDLRHYLEMDPQKQQAFAEQMKNPAHGHIFDFFAIDYEFPNGVHTLSMCRQVSKCADSISEALVGTKGVCRPDQYSINHQRVMTRAQDQQSVDPYIQEHTDLIESIRASKPINELKNVAESTLTAIMGRMSAYTGKEVTWDAALNSKLNLYPENLDWDTKLEVPEVALPGTTPLI
jgi:myo-inositol 2-dehydrogenase / D-chiro-inositol 1-dehydrogenase